jgi:hypothetical protein
MQDARSSRRLSGLAASVLAALFAPAAAAFDGTQAVMLGERLTATIGAPPFDTHRFTFDAVKGTRLGLELRVGEAGPRPGLRLLTEGGEPIDLRKRLRARRSGAVRVRGLRLEGAGRFVIEVAGQGTRGTYALETTGRPPRTEKAKGTVVAGATAEVPIEALPGWTLTIHVRRARPGALVPAIVGLVDPEGDSVDLAGRVRSRGRVSQAKDVVVLTPGAHRLLVAGLDGSAGAFRVRVPRRIPRPTRRRHDLGVATTLPATYVEPGDPLLAPDARFAGSLACQPCHPRVFDRWARTFHNKAVRSPLNPGVTGLGVVADANQNGVDDFKDGLDLATTSAFAPYGANAPRLSYVEGAARPYKMTIGAVTYDVSYVMGGNGRWKHRFLLAVGNGHYPSPVQYNERTHGYVTYDPADWYDSANRPRYTNPATIVADIDRTDSFARRCSGCHHVGETIAYDAAAGEWLSGYVEVNIGCERCHGPGRAHVDADGAKELILDPRDLLDGTVAGAMRAVEVCEQCHSRGASTARPAGAPKGFDFPWSPAPGANPVSGFYEPRAILAAFFALTRAASDFWGYKTNPLGTGVDTFVASKSHRQQGIDMLNGPHAPDKPNDAACFDCHDPHSPIPRMIVSRRTLDGVRLRTAAADNTLCLSCHAGYGPFAGVTATQVAAIGAGTTPPEVAASVTAHMADSGMWVDASLYDPTGTGVGRCDGCHMPQLSRTAVREADAAGYLRADIRTHTFEPVWPNVSEKYGGVGNGPTNSCTGCHPTAPGDEAAVRIAEWAKDGPDADGTFHADTPRSFQNAVANPHGAAGGMACVACHTTQGFIDVQVRGGPTPSAAARAALIADSVERDVGITCRACHGPDGDGVLQPDHLRFPVGELCSRCHNQQTLTFADYAATGELVRHPQKEMLEGTAGAEVPGVGGYQNSFHSRFPRQCVQCHYNRDDRSHDFEPTLSTCRSVACHGVGLPTMNRPAFGNYDGDGTTEGIQDEVRGLLALLETTLPTLDPAITFDGALFRRDGNSQGFNETNSSAALLRALFNYYSVRFDGSHGVHNAPRAIRLLQQSYRELTGMDVPGAVIR